MKTYNISELTDSQIMYKHRPLSLVVFLFSSIACSLILLLIISVYVNKENSYSALGEFRSFDKQVIAAPQDGELLLHLSPLNRQVKKDQLIASIRTRAELIEITAPITGTFDMETAVLNGSNLSSGDSIGILTNLENLYVEVVLNHDLANKVKAGDKVNIHTAESTQEYAGIVSDVKAAHSDDSKSDYLVSIKLNDYKSTSAVTEGAEAEVIFEAG